MTRSTQLSARFLEVILDGTWIANTNYYHQLNGLDWQIALAQVESLNTIALLAQHIHYYIDGIKQAILHNSLDIRDANSFDFPSLTSQKDWEVFLDRFWTDSKELALLIHEMPEEQLEQDFILKKYGSYYRNIDGMIEHSYYHLGQIVLIKKMIQARPDLYL